MMTAENNRGAELAGKLNLGEVTGWRLLWMRNELQRLRCRMQLAADFTSDGGLGVVEQFVAELRSFDVQLVQLRWEVKTMLGFDYDSEVNALFEHLPQYAEYQEQMRQAKTFLERKTQQILEAKEKTIQASLDAIKGLV